MYTSLHKNSYYIQNINYKFNSDLIDKCQIFYYIYSVIDSAQQINDIPPDNIGKNIESIEILFFQVLPPKTSSSD